MHLNNWIAERKVLNNTLVINIELGEFDPGSG